MLLGKFSHGSHHSQPPLPCPLAGSAMTGSPNTRWGLGYRRRRSSSTRRKNQGRRASVVGREEPQGMVVSLGSQTRVRRGQSGSRRGGAGCISSPPHSSRSVGRSCKAYRRTTLPLRTQSSSFHWTNSSRLGSYSRDLEVLPLLLLGLPPPGTQL